MIAATSRMVSSWLTTGSSGLSGSSVATGLAGQLVGDPVGHRLVITRGQRRVVLHVARGPGTAPPARPAASLGAARPLGHDQPRQPPLGQQLRRLQGVVVQTRRPGTPRPSARRSLLERMPKRAAWTRGGCDATGSLSSSGTAPGGSPTAAADQTSRRTTYIEEPSRCVFGPRVSAAQPPTRPPRSRSARPVSPGWVTEGDGVQAAAGTPGPQAKR